MGSAFRRALIADFGVPITSAVQSGLELLVQARTTAERLGQDKWDFALEIDALKEAGLNHNDLRFLVCQGLAEHRVEETRSGAKHRVFRPPAGLRLAPRSCFALSETSFPVACQLLAGASRLPASARRVAAPICRSEVPFWDRERRELRLGTVLVKRFRQPARNQETILAAFQEDGWPAHLDNPLAGDDATLARDRLHDTVRKLNQQTNRLLQFLSDGNGEGVLWDFAGGSVPRAS
jgi:hypothetical protein